MFKAALALLFATPLGLLAQSTPDATTLSAPAPMASHSANTMAPAHPLPEAPRGSLTASFAYVYNDAYQGPNRQLMGWAVVPELNLFKHIGLQGDFESLYMKSVYPSQSRFIMAAGPVYYLAPRSKVTPFVFAEGGEMRLTGQGMTGSDWNPVVKGGFGVNYRLSHAWAFQLIPGEYLGQQQDDHNWNHSFSARAGITLNFVPRG
ncbi:hypothetical protein [Acidipila sp. EB88]|uniref:hypothetical protein n=1 Tax=Acidipila sp. EB88 TaxID=2305226 RepID=UPI000F600B61|nr:hypothetical protein [Acidipila sp. EB88]RRA47567.1 hypothetical protein D1Y84_03900 [Acidipila sp. EB88]